MDSAIYFTAAAVAVVLIVVNSFSSFFRYFWILNEKVNWIFWVSARIKIVCKSRWVSVCKVKLIILNYTIYIFCVWLNPTVIQQKCRWPVRFVHTNRNQKQSTITHSIAAAVVVVRVWYALYTFLVSAFEFLHQMKWKRKLSKSMEFVVIWWMNADLLLFDYFVEQYFSIVHTVHRKAKYLCNLHMFIIRNGLIKISLNQFAWHSAMVQSTKHKYFATKQLHQVFTICFLLNECVIKIPSLPVFVEFSNLIWIVHWCACPFICSHIHQDLASLNFVEFRMISL